MKFAEAVFTGKTKKVVRDNVQVRVGDTVELNVEMAVGAGVPGGLVCMLNCCAGALSPLPWTKAAGKWLLLTSTRVPTSTRSKSWITSRERMRMQP